jgi:hypothetical protein
MLLLPVDEPFRVSLKIVKRFLLRGPSGYLPDDACSAYNHLIPGKRSQGPDGASGKTSLACDDRGWQRISW